MAKQLLPHLRLIARINFSLKNYSCELFNLTGTVGKVELISTFTALFMDQTLSEDILVSISFWSLLIIDSVARVFQHVIFTHDLLVKQV